MAKKNRVAYMNHQKNQNVQIKNDSKKDDNGVKKTNWFFRSIKALIVGFLTIIIYGIVIKFVTGFLMSLVQTTATERGLTSDPILFLTFTVGISSAIIAVFIAKVNVYKLIMKGLDKSVNYVQNGLNKANERKVQKEKSKQGKGETHGGKSRK